MAQLQCFRLQWHLFLYIFSHVFSSSVLGWCPTGDFVAPSCATVAEKLGGICEEINDPTRGPGFKLTAFPEGYLQWQGHTFDDDQNGMTLSFAFVATIKFHVLVELMNHICYADDDTSRTRSQSFKFWSVVNLMSTWVYRGPGARTARILLAHPSAYRIYIPHSRLFPRYLVLRMCILLPEVRCESTWNQRCTVVPSSAGRCCVRVEYDPQTRLCTGFCYFSNLIEQWKTYINLASRLVK